MFLLPFAFLDRNGRGQIGMRTPRANGRAWRAIGWGAGLAAGCFCLGWGMFGDGPDNWFVSVRDYYQANPSAVNRPTWMQFLIFTAPAVLFSPFGEEIFFRGYLRGYAVKPVRFGLLSLLMPCLTA